MEKREFGRFATIIKNKMDMNYIIIAGINVGSLISPVMFYIRERERGGGGRERIKNSKGRVSIRVGR